MSKQNVVLKLDKQWYDALSSRLKENGTTVENQLCECFDMMLNQLPAPVYEKISREIWEEEQRRTAAEHRVSALRITQDGQTDCLLTQGRGAMDAMCVAECLRNYLLLRGNTSLRFVQGLINGEDVTPEEFEHCADELREGMGLATTVLDIDIDRGEFSVLDSVNGWETYTIRDVCIAAWYADRMNDTTRDMGLKTQKSPFHNRIARGGKLCPEKKSSSPCGSCRKLRSWFVSGSQRTTARARTSSLKKQTIFMWSISLPRAVRPSCPPRWCPHIKGGTKAAAHRSNYVRYAATRDGVELVAKRENYVDYIANRPRAQKLGAHGLFTAGDEPLVLSHVADEVAHHPGTVWLPIISLQREDAARLGYDNTESWQTLLTQYAPEMAKAMKIPLDQFRWYAAFHDEKHHPHLHMVVYSADGKSGFLTEHGIESIKSMLAKEIFEQDLIAIYQRQTQRRDELTEDAGETMRRLVSQMQNGALDNQRIEQLMTELAKRLQRCSGKKQYGYLSPPLKSIVDEIVDELAKDFRIAGAYDLWYQEREEVLRTYKDDLPERVPLSKQKEFKRIKNIVIGEAVKLGDAVQEVETGSSSDADQPRYQPDAPSAPARPKAPTSGQLFNSAASLLSHMGRIFQEQHPQPLGGARLAVDSKLRWQIREKKIAMGHKADDHEDGQQMQ